MVHLAHPVPGEECLLQLGPTREAIVSWNARELEGALEMRVNAADGRTSGWLPYVVFASDRRTSRNGHDTFVRIDTDVVRADVDFVALGVRSRGPLDALYVSTPDYGAPSPIVALPAVELALPPLSQYVPAYPAETGWCAPASLAMLTAYRGFPLDLQPVVNETFDAAYHGTGNWAFNAAFAARLGFRAAVLHLRDLAHAHAFLSDDIPLALSIAWERGALAGAPLERSNGHVLVLRGIDEAGDALVCDPARSDVVATYQREAFERAWLGHGGIAIAVVPAPMERTLLALANG